MVSDALIRFVVPTLGRNLEWLELTLDSVARQQVDVDLVLVAPASASLDGLAKQYGARIVSERGQSLSEALNQGFEDLPAAVRYLGWLGDDDVLAPGSLALTVGVLENEPRASLVLGRVRYIDANGDSKWVIRSGAWAARYAVFGKNFMSQPGSLMRRDAFENVGGLDIGLRNSMDQDLFIKLSRVGKVVYVNREVASFRVHATSISSTKGAGDESALVSQRYAPRIPGVLVPLVKAGLLASDRFLLSVLPRIPHADAPDVGSRPYYRSGRDDRAG
ncbi:glycosyltransferase [Kocuria salina]|nr:glycosyltransferase [Kocuria salina]NVC24691.1 glycosyltransferase [Kocuria salina]